MKIGRSIVLALMISLWSMSGAPRLRAEDRDLSVVAKQMEQHLQARRTHIPMWGFLKLFIKLPYSGRGVDFALFEEQDFRSVDPGELEKRILAGLGSEWKPIVRVQSRKSKEWTLICTKVNGKKFKMMIVNMEPSEAVVVKLNLHPKDLSNWMDEEICRRQNPESSSQEAEDSSQNPESRRQNAEVRRQETEGWR